MPRDAHPAARLPADEVAVRQNAHVRVKGPVELQANQVAATLAVDQQRQVPGVELPPARLGLRNGLCPRRA